MKFNSSKTTISVRDEFFDDFTNYMATKVPDLQRWAKNKKRATEYAVECAIRDHSEWFEFSFCNFSRTPKFYGKDPEFYIQERVSSGLALMEPSA
ncbi:hypothetical protein [Methanospirillum sp.]|uniref:hypothetical protein n=1 Tax=Methanospirillum sp. TaxID=45200 RepID=UPI002D7FCE95|nr:hypothetical protein [Methanospirillum sp.]